jgi:spermidine synthase
MELVGNATNLRRAVGVAGAASLLAQVVLLREILAFSQGNEIVLGIVFGVWLCLTAAGSALGARPFWQVRRSATALYLLLALAPLFYLAALWLTQLGQPGVLGEAPHLSSILLASLAALVPACGLGGLAFAWAIKASAEPDPTGLYVAETAGAAVAGLLFHFVLGERLSSLWVLGSAGVACAVASMGLGWHTWRLRSLALPVAAIVAALVIGPTVAASVEAARFPGETALVSRPSRYGLLAVLARGEQRVFLQDGVLLFTSEDQIAAEERAHLPLLLHPAPRRVLFLGGGLGGGLVEALKHQPDRIDYAEVDPALLDLAALYAGSETKHALANPHVRTVAGDGRGLLRRARQEYDVILVDVPVPQNALMARYSTRECFEDARRALAPGGVLALVLPGSDTHLGEAARQRHSAILSTLTGVFPSVGSAPGAQTILWASIRPIDARPAVLAARLRERSLQLVQVGPTWLFDRLLPMHVATYQRMVGAAPAIESRDFRPVVYLFGLIETLQRIYPSGAGKVLALALAQRVWMAIGVGGFLLALLLAARRARRAPGLAAAAAGASGMALQVVLLVAYQSLCGHLYHGIGVLLAAFMAGMSIGALAAGRIARRSRALAWGVAAVGGLAIVVAGFLAIGRFVPEAATAIILLLLAAVGAATGGVYPAAVQEAVGIGAGARLYAWDLVGAALAAFVASLVAIPLFGLLPVALLCAALCTVAAVANR